MQEFSIHIAAGERTLVAIDDFGIAEHRMTLLLGESGIGKSLIAKAIYGLLDGDELAVTINGTPYEQYRAMPATHRLQRESFFVFQEPSTHLNPLMPLGDQLREGSLRQTEREEEILGRLWRNAPDEVRSILQVYPKPYRPSGGEKQRILLAMAFKKLDMLMAAGDPGSAVFVFDEPTGSLDNAYRDLFMDMVFERFRKMNFTCLLITHDYSMIGRMHDSHRDLMQKTEFKELVLKGGGLVLDTFEPDVYLGWLRQQRPLESPQAEQKPLLRVESGVRVFGRTLVFSRSKHFDRACTLQLQRGEIVYLKAASGVGKTTIVKLVMGLLQGDRFAARVDGREISERTGRHFWKHIWGKKMTMVFQHADEALNPEATVKGIFAGLPGVELTTDAAVTALLTDLFDGEKIPSLLRKNVKHLSGGQKQRLNLMRGFALDTDVLILDEPLNGLDFESAGKVIALLQRKQKAGKGILLISHNEEIFDRIVDDDHIYYLQAEGAELRSLPENR